MLAKLGDQRAVEPLVALLSDSHGALRPVVARALEALNWNPADDAQRLQYALAREDWDEVVKMGESAAVRLTAALEDTDEKGRKKAMEALERVGAPAVRAIGCGAE